uniref:Portal protein n=1 Tax=viral metagenome TaxID=1070528 RepID=A0A6H1ZKE8_9ZZZZ
MQNLFQIVEQFEHDFLHTPVEIVVGYNFDQLETIKENQRYYSSKFRNGNTDEFGYKFFYNIGKPRVKNAAKNIDLDIKDINIRAKNPKDYYKAWLMRRDMRRWMKERSLGILFNEIVMKTPKYGTFVLKKVVGDEIVRPVDLKNLKCDPSTQSLKVSGWVIEDHFYTPWELKQEVKRGWDIDKINLAIKSFRDFRKENYVDATAEEQNKGTAQYIHIKEFYGDIPESTFKEEGDPDKFVLANYIIVSPEKGTKANTDKEAEKEGLLLFKKEIKEIPYKECHYDREEGRWLGVGIIEDLRESQIMKNEEINQVMLALKLANLVLFQTGDETIARNILTDLVNGDIIKVKSDLARIDTTNKGIGESNVISQEIEALANNLANSFEVTTGESLPSGTPFSLGMLINQNANKLFDFVRENIGLFLEEVFEDWIIPELSKDLNKEHILELTDKEEMEWVNERFKSNHLLSKIKDFILNTGRKPTQEEVDMAQQILSQRMEGKEHLYFEVPEKFYDFDKSVEVDITGESMNKQATLQTLASIMQMVGGNPEMLEHPAMQKIMDISGFNDVDFRVAKPQAQQLPMAGQLAGGMPVPQLAQ